ncbi:hypothetical protein H5410_056468 [Solanum commersonii]|uniref:Uncharacterized protein n=1 Tax=Solanum commersonii TaxID=4109 RepID=A0A9J5WN62_SOLCO|nr:hypothetical protein H5410_056468 [Solanum commersonii]
MSLEVVNQPFCQFSCAIVHGSFGDPHFRLHEYFGDLNFQGHFCRNVSWTSVKTLAMEPIKPNGKIGPFSRSNETRSWTLAMESVDPDGQSGPFSWLNEPCSRFLTSFLLKKFLDVRQDLSYGVSWSRRENWPFSRSKNPKIGFPTSFLSKFIMDIHHDLRNRAGWSRWANLPILKVKQALEQVNPYFADFRVILLMDLLVIHISNVIYAKIFCGHPSRY